MSVGMVASRANPPGSPAAKEMLEALLVSKRMAFVAILSMISCGTPTSNGDVATASSITDWGQ